MSTNTSKIEGNDAFCLMPWLHLHVSTRGLCQACCIAPITFGDINKQTIGEIWNGVKINEFRSNLLSGKKDKRCRGCYDLEDSGVKSIRQETLEKYGYKINDIIQDDIVSKPVYLDIRFSNVCNFRCVTCWHGASSKWFEEAKATGTNVAKTAIIKAINKEDEFFQQLESIVSGVEEFYFAGGEPLVMDQHYRVLELLLKKEKKGVHLRYNTNLSLLDFKGKSVIEYWKQFHKVTVSASIDAAGELGEKIRRDSDWSTIKQNLKVIKSECPHVQLEIAPTISALNVAAITSLHKQLVEEGLIDIDSIYINMLSRPDQFHIKNVENKTHVIDQLRQHLGWLKTSEASTETIKKINEILVCIQSYQ
ncbi:twitch domain-containing radical SAM protein [Reichenbachiella versicolor]|uniref:twitch domain-containing radical SAM protein n=1 Tax=Reichenbachiella versicolor TaxID=1821036 RepID=UPI000D6DFC5E|nr:twitch domain-containing radical SAM protein [Reichenbachiella versicolor]